MAEPLANSADHVRSPPSRFLAILGSLGPGMIIAGSIVGSGELIATTKAGAAAGFSLLWLIIIGCAIKVFTQVEFGRHTLCFAKTPLAALNDVPGPRWRVNWIVWYWFIMMVLVISQAGGIVGGIGQALMVSQPLTRQGSQFNDLQNQLVEQRVELAVMVRMEDLEERWSSAGRSVFPEGGPAAVRIARDAQAELTRLRAARKGQATADGEIAISRLEVRIGKLEQRIGALGEPKDAYLWAVIVAIVTSVAMIFGRYGLIQAVATVLVVAFTIVTIVTAVLLEAQPHWQVTPEELVSGLSFRLPPRIEGMDSPIVIALAAFGIIGVGAGELIQYPYWCLEKGYVKHTGPRDGSAQWIERARGWMRVMRIDAWLSMAVYTFATIAFYLLGAAVLGRAGLNPEGQDMVRTLAQMYVPVFGSWAPAIFLFGAFAVLYSTFFVSAAGNSRILGDAFGLLGWHDGSERTRLRWARIMSVAWPLVAVSLYVVVRAPAAMVLASGVAQMLMLPMLGFAALWFRYRRCDAALRPTRLWDLLLWLSVGGFVVIAAWYVGHRIYGFIGTL